MAGDAAQLDGLAVELQDVAIDGELTEAEPMFEGLYRPALLEERRTQLI